MNHTQNYQLNQWEPGDPVLHTDFNEDNRKIEAALKARNIHTFHYSYTGNGATSQSFSTYENATPIMVFITGGGASLLMLRPAAKAVFWNAAGKLGVVDVEWNEKGLIWRSTNGDPELVCSKENIEYACMVFMTLI